MCGKYYWPTFRAVCWDFVQRSKSSLWHPVQQNFKGMPSTAGAETWKSRCPWYIQKFRVCSETVQSRDVLTFHSLPNDPWPGHWVRLGGGGAYLATHSSQPKCWINHDALFIFSDLLGKPTKTLCISNFILLHYMFQPSGPDHMLNKTGTVLKWFPPSSLPRKWKSIQNWKY